MQPHLTLGDATSIDRAKHNAKGRSRLQTARKWAQQRILRNLTIATQNDILIYYYIYGASMI